MTHIVQIQPKPEKLESEKQWVLDANASSIKSPGLSELCAISSPCSITGVSLRILLHARLKWTVIAAHLSEVYSLGVHGKSSPVLMPALPATPCQGSLLLSQPVMVISTRS